MRVLRVYHEGRDPAHRERDRALVQAGAELLLVTPRVWPGADDVADDLVRIVALPVMRQGDVNRHLYANAAAVGDLVQRFRPDVVDLHEEPFSSVVHQLLRVLPRDQAVVGYTAQNVDKRFPPPFAQYERSALRRLDALYPCSAQAASVAVGKGFRGAVQVLPLAPSLAFSAGQQTPPVDELHLLLVGRMVPEKGVRDAVRVLAAAGPAATLTLIGDGPELGPARELAARLGVADAVHVEAWVGAQALAEHYRRAHVVLVPSTATQTWAEQFGRVVVEAHAAGAVVVAYASGALPDVVGTAGLLVDEGDVSAMSAAVAQLRRAPEQWAALRNAGLGAAITWGDVAAGQLALYEQALAVAARRAGVRRGSPVRADRGTAVTRYGPTARLGGVARPFALPVLRADTAASRAVASAIDVGTGRTRRARPDRPRVVYLDHVAQLSGGEIALARLLAALPDVDAHVILGADGPLRTQLEDAGAEVEVLELDAGARDTRRDVAVGAGGVRAAAALTGHTARLARRLRQLRPDVVHANSLKSGYYGTAAARLAGVPLVWHLRDRLVDDYLPTRAITATHALLRSAAAVLCPSREVASHVGGPAVVIPDPYAASRSPREPGEHLRTIGVVGRISPWKGQDVALRALAHLPDLRLRVIGSPMFGEDAYLAQLRGLAAELGVVDRVDFVGFVADVEDELRRLDVLVHASTVAEPFGQVIVEGLAAGVPVVATDAGGPREIVTDHVDGLLVAPGDADALAGALRELAGDPALRAQLVANGVQRAAAFAPYVIGSQVQALYREVLGR